MRRLLIASTLLAFSGLAYAQPVVISPEQEVLIREYIVTQPAPPPTEIPADVPIEVGTPIPETIELYPLEAPDLVEYRYIVVDGRTVLVEPETREILYILE